MSEKFDPYHEWLGIPAIEQPPDHYRLLGVPALEENPAVIESAADRQMAHLRTFQNGKYAVDSQRLLNEVAAARVCLLKPEKKSEYDRLLRETTRETTVPAADPGLADLFETSTVSTSRIGAKDRAKKKCRSKSMALIGAAVTAIVAMGLFGVWLADRNGGAPSGEGPTKPADLATSTAPPKEAPKAADIKSDALKSEDLKSEIPKSEISKSDPAPEPSEPKAAAQAMPAPEAAPTTDTKPAIPDSPPKKIAPPPADEQKRLMGEIDDIYKPAGLKDPAAKVALARKLLEFGQKDEAKPAEQFVLFRRAGEIARDAGDADLMLEAVDAIATAGFDIQPYQVKSRFLKKLVEQDTLDTPALLSAAAASCEKFAEDAAANGAIDDALDVLAVADKSLNEPIKQAQATFRNAQAQFARARIPTDKAERQTKVDEAKTELDSLKAAQSALVECAKGLQQARREHEVIQAAQDRLKTAPDDPDANLAVGRWYCFHQGDWDEGLKFLAKGSDAGLKSLAAGELGSKPSKPDELAVRGDAWWDAAEAADPKTKAAMRQRAGYWYQEAAPGLPSGLAKMKVEKRLAETAEKPSTPVADTSAAAVRPPLAVAPFDEKTAKQHQARWASYLRVPVVQTNSIGMKLVLIPPGEFDMGSPKELIEEEQRLHTDDDWYRNHLSGEEPQHRVRITRPCWLGATEVTQEEYQRVMGTNPSKVQGDLKRPVEQVSWDDAVEFCKRLSALPEETALHRRYELPTEAQWEHACRAGSAGRFSFSPSGGANSEKSDETTLSDYGWFDKNSGETTHTVGGKRPNAWGLYDMHGNVWEWCQDWYDKDYYATSPAIDPTGPREGSDHVLRGGGWKNPAQRCRSANRDNVMKPWAKGDDLGFRVSVIIADSSPKRATVSRTANAVQPSGGWTVNSPPLAVAPFDARTAKQHQARWARYARVPVVQTNSIGMQLVLIPPGEFQMGSPEPHADTTDDEKPRHLVRITKAFQLGITEVTQQEYQQVMDKNPGKWHGDPKMPIERVSWNDAMEFARRLSELPAEKAAKRRYGLPTEAQWEYACRAGTTGRYSFSNGDDAVDVESEEKTLSDYGWSTNNSGSKAHTVGAKRPNAWGLYDMHGNVWEWCADWFEAGYSERLPVDDPTGPATGTSRVMRGGSWYSPASATRSATRSHGPTVRRNPNTGFRICTLSAEAASKTP